MKDNSLLADVNLLTSGELELGSTKGFDNGILKNTFYLLRLMKFF